MRHHGGRETYEAAGAEHRLPARKDRDVAVELDQRLLDILRCPAPEHGELRPGRGDDPAADYLTCVSCGRSYPVDPDGIPVLLLDEAIGPDAEAGG
jgi:uncharacterized protein YbaR (Trm112 family)